MIINIIDKGYPVSESVASAVDLGFDPRSGQPTEYKIGISCSPLRIIDLILFIFNNQRSMNGAVE
jgi:hypothetical protein